MQYNPWQVAEHAARQTRASLDENSSSARLLTSSRGQNQKRKLEGRDRNVASIAEGSRSPVKRKAAESEDGELRIGGGDVEAGEIVEDQDADLGDEFEEVIQDGRVMKMRRVEAV